MSAPLLKRVAPDDVTERRRDPVDPDTLRAAAEIVDAVRRDGVPAIRRYAERFGECPHDAPLTLGRVAMSAALDRIPADDRGVLERTADRIRHFAEAQRAALRDIDVEVPGGRAGHTVVPVSAAGCYAPAGRHPLPSSLLMTAVTARTAGCDRIVVATPNPDDLMLAAAAVAGADEVLAVGGAHAIAALAYGFEGFAPCDVIAGPGNRWVTAAKKLVHGAANIDMLAGPSELVVLADDTADPAVVAADLLAQAEHDVDAASFLVTTETSLAAQVDTELRSQLDALPTSETARVALSNGFACTVRDVEQGLDVCAKLAPEHLELHVAEAESILAKVRNAGAVFVGYRAAEVFGDYGAGINHTLPTGGTARAWSGLSVLNFSRIQTWLALDKIDARLARDVSSLARLEGLHAHGVAAKLRGLR